MKVSLVLLMLQWQHQARALHSERVNTKTLRRSENDANRVKLDLCTNSIHANLGGLGGVNVGETGPEDKTPDGEWKNELRYKKVATLPTGEKLDLVVTNLTEYVPVHLKQFALLGDTTMGEEGPRGRKGCLGSINMKAPGSVQLKFELVVRGTDTPAPKNYSYDFTVLDIDRSKYGMYEQITAHGFAYFVAPSIEPIGHIEQVGPGEVAEFLTFEPRKGAVEVPNPDGLDLTVAQLNASVGLVFENVNHWKITAKAIDPPGGIGGLEVGRNIFFAGSTLLQSDGRWQKTSR